jgi:hypothetical protein
LQLTQEAIFNIDSKVVNLKEIFRRKDPLEERTQAAVCIQSAIRRFLVQRRLLAFQSSQRTWRWIRCRPVVYLLGTHLGLCQHHAYASHLYIYTDILLSNQSKLDAGFHLLKMNRAMTTMLVVFGKWAFVCRQNAPGKKLYMYEDKI